jgi:hypothetical protein
MQDLRLRLDGKKSFPSPITAPQGALEIADNVVITRKDTIESRRGFKRINAQLTGDINNIFEYKDVIYTAYDDKLAKSTDPTWTDLTGALVAPNDYRIKSAQQNQNMYLTSTEGIKKINVTNNSLDTAGVPQGLPLEGTLAGAAGLWFAVDNQVAYRIVWTIEDENDNLIIGAPSARLTMTNPAVGAVSQVDLTIQIPAGITVNHKYQLYRTALSGNETTPPNDEMQLVREENPTAGEITAGTIAYSDLTEEGNRGVFLYTSPSQEGITQANFVPPHAEDMAVYKNTVMYSNVKWYQSVNLILNEVGAGNFAVGDTITIDGDTFTAVGGAPAADQFQLITTGTDGENAYDTAYNLCVAINKSSTLTDIEAHYTGAPGVSPGSIQLIRTTFNGASFSVTVNSTTAGDAWTPKIPTSGTDVTSTDDAKPHGLFVSKRNQPESVPIVNFILVGSKEHPIDRIVAQSDAVFIFKKDGVYRLTGEIFENFRVYQFDDTNQLIAPDSAVNYNDAVFCLTNQGIMAFTSSSPQMVSLDIEEEILEKVNFADIDKHTFAIPYEVDRKYVLFTIQNDGDSPANIAYVYDSITRAWTNWTMTQVAGFTNPDVNKLYLCGSDDWVREERKDFDDTDYSDDEYAVNITAFDGSYVVTLTSVTDVAVGQSLYQSGRKAKITAIDGLDITLAETAPWSIGAATVHNSIPVSIRWLPQYADNPGLNKRWQEITLMFRNMRLRPVTIGLISLMLRKLLI